MFVELLIKKKEECIILGFDVPCMIQKSATMNLTKIDGGWVWLCCLSFGV
jgi:hypothetical protein